MRARGGMHQTTVRFTEELWTQLEHEAAVSGISAAQYIRDATLARLAYTAGQRGDGFFGDGQANRMRDAGDASVAARSDSAAVWAQARLARERSRVVRQDARTVQADSGRGQRPGVAGGAPSAEAER